MADTERKKWKLEGIVQQKLSGNGTKKLKQYKRISNPIK